MILHNGPSFRAEGLRELMRQHGLSESDFARRAGVSRQLVYAWLGGSQPRYDTVLRICTAFGVDANYFMEGVPEQCQTATTAR